MRAERTENGKNYYAWVIFGMCFLMIFVALGFGSSTKGTFLTAVTGQLGLRRSLFTVADSLRYITTAIMSFFLGKTVEKIGLRRMAGFGFGFLVISFTVNSFAADYWMFYVGGVFLGAGLCWTTTSMVGYLVENWFSNGKGTIMGILLAANGLGGFASEFIVTKIIYGADGSLPDELSRWRLGYRVIAVIFAVVGILAVLIIRSRPEDIGLQPLGRDMKKKAKRGADWPGIEMSELIRKPYFYVSAVCVYLTGFSLQAMVNVSKPYMYDLGFDKNRVIFIFAAHSIMLMAAKTVTGIGYDTIGMRKTFGACCAAALVSLMSLYLLTPDNELPAWIYSFVSAFGLPLETVMIPLLCSYMFGRRSYKRVFGYYLSINSLGYATGVPLVNLAYDLQGTYRGMILVLAIVIAVVAVVQQISMAAADRVRKELAEKPENI